MSKLDQRGDVFIAVIVILWIGLAAFVIFKWQQSSNYQKAFQAWTGDCYAVGGEIKVSGANMVDCFVNDEPCQVVGYEKYQELNPNPKFNNLSKCEKKGS